MATADHVKALVQSHSEGDHVRFYAVALQIAAQAAQNGHTKIAHELRDLIDRAREQSGKHGTIPRTEPVPIVQPRGELAGLLTASYPKIRSSDMVLDQSALERFERVLLEQRQRTEIRSHGVSPIHKLLLVGPSGTGKTMTAAALSGELGIPLLTIQLDGLISRYLGETAAKLRLIFDSVQTTRGVYFFDEFDALGSKRATRNEVGEMRRALSSFLQFLEQDDSDSIIVGATNHHEILDKALFRRFDYVVRYSLPSKKISEKVMRARLALLDTSQVNWRYALEAGEGLSHSELTRACEHAAKSAILQGHARIESNELLDALRANVDQNEPVCDVNIQRT